MKWWTFYSYRKVSVDPCGQVNVTSKALIYWQGLPNVFLLFSPDIHLVQRLLAEAEMSPNKQKKIFKIMRGASYVQGKRHRGHNTWQTKGVKTTQCSSRHWLEEDDSKKRNYDPYAVCCCKLSWLASPISRLNEALTPARKQFQTFCWQCWRGEVSQYAAMEPFTAMTLNWD